MPDNGFSYVSFAATSISAEKPEDNNPLISAEKLRQLYTAMLESRLMAQRSRNPRKRQSVGGRHEACEVGCTIDLRAADTIALPPYQCIGHRGTKLAPGGKSVEKDLGGTLLRAEVPTAINLPQFGDSAEHLVIATGVAFAYAAQKSTSVVVAFGETKRIKQAHDSIAYALENCLPIIYVELADRSEESRHAARPGRKSSPPIATMPVDRNDVIAVYRVACEAIGKARRSAGPSLIQCISYEPHSPRKRSTDFHNTDPVAYMEGYLKQKNLWSPDLKRSIEQAIRA